MVRPYIELIDHIQVIIRLLSTLYMRARKRRVSIELAVQSEAA